jgi:DNA-binding CsgD family transcriptional regulator
VGALVERESELGTIAAAVERAAGGNGSVLVVEGEPGIGKTELIRAALAQAPRRGLTALLARGGELEREFAYGVVRQLIIPALAALPDGARTQITAGAARLAAPVLGLNRELQTVAPEQGAVLHGLYWLVVELAEREPLLLALDDAHWCDGASLRFLAFLARRLEGMPVLLVLSHRDGAGGERSAALAQLLDEPLTSIVRPPPLSEPAVSSLIAEALGEPVDAAFAAACRRATGGVPFLVRELLRALAADGVAPAAASVALIDGVGPRTIGRSTMLRLAQLGAAATSAARAAALLGEQASVERIAGLAGLSPGEAAAGLDALAAGQVIEPGRPVRFRHPLLRSAVYEDIPSFDRLQLHARAARLIADAGGDAEAVAAHLLATEPSGSAEEVELLTAAAAGALARAAPESAVAYLRRALSGMRAGAGSAAVRFELGRCEQLIRDPACIEDLRAALAAAADPALRARIAMALADSLFYALDLVGGWEVLRTAIDELGTGDGDVAAQLLTMASYVGYGDPRLHGPISAGLDQLRELARRPGPARRELSIFLGLVAATDGADAGRALALVQRGLDGGALLEALSADSTVIAVAIHTLVFIDELDAAGSLADAMLADARRRGLVLGFVAGSAHRGLVALRRGELVRAEAEIRAALELALQHELHFTVPFALTYLGAALLERGAAGEGLELLSAMPRLPGFDVTLAGATLGVTRGRLQLATGEREAGIATLLAAGAALDAVSIVNPNCQPWRSELALALASDDPERARSLAARELRLARQVGSPRAIGVALRAVALLAGGAGGIELLRESVATLARSADRLEHARALVDLGAALRRAGARTDAREPLRAGLELAARIDAAPLVDRALREVAASGGRPRRLMITGRDALTASEQRIAELAARGQSNREIAQALFITPKTVENHLGRVYRKLAVNARAQLAAALAAERAAPADQS